MSRASPPRGSSGPLWDEARAPAESGGGLESRMWLVLLCSVRGPVLLCVLVLQAFVVVHPQRFLRVFAVFLFC